jgi:autotransporter-associated beta strand protein
LNLTGTGQLIVNADNVSGGNTGFLVAERGTAVINIANSAALTVYGAGESEGAMSMGRRGTASATVNQTGGTVTLYGNHFIAGRWDSSEGTYNISGGVLKTAGNSGNRRFHLAWDSTLAKGALNISGTGEVIVNANNENASGNPGSGLQVGYNGTGTVTVADSGKLTVYGIEDGDGALFVAFNNGTSSFTQTGGDVRIYDGRVRAGRSNSSNGTINVEGGTFIHGLSGAHALTALPNDLNAYLGWDSAAARGEVNVGSNGTLTLGGNLFVGGNGTGSVTVNGGALAVPEGIHLAWNAGSTGSLDVDGGVLTTGGLARGSGAGSALFDDGSLRAAASFGTAMPITIGPGGLTVDTAGKLIGLAGSLSGDGGLTKTGAGTLALGATNTFHGDVTINEGTVKLDVLAASSLWLDATDLDSIVKDGSNLVSQWRDTTGKPDLLAQTNTARQPTYVATAINDLPSIRFDTAGGADQLFNTIHYQSPVTIFSVSRLTGGANQRLITSYVNNWLLGYHNPGVDRAHFDGWVHNPSVSADTRTHMYEAVIRGSGQNSDFYVFDDRNPNVRLLASSTGGTTGPNGLALGAWQSGASQGSNGDVAEILVFRGVLAADQRAVVEDYLAAKWHGISLGAASPNIIPDTARVAITAAGAALDLNGYDETIGSLEGVPGASVLLGGGTLTTGGDGTDTEFAGEITGSIGFGLKTLDNYAPGTHSITAAGQTFDVHVDDDGTNTWLLVGRGRQGWDFDTEGQGAVADVILNLGTPDAFSPAAYSDAIVNDLLVQSGLNMTGVEVRVRRAADPEGTAYQEVRWTDFSGNGNAWTWNIEDSQYAVTETRLNAPDGLAGAETGSTRGNTRDHMPNEHNDADRIFTWAWSGHANQKGFSYGSAVSNGANNATSFLWENSNENHAIPYTEVYVRSLSPVAAQLVKVGSGTLTLSGVSTHTGPTTVEAGTLLVHGSMDASAVTVWDNATLGGYGSTGSVVVQSDGHLSPGNNPGQITHTGLTLEPGSNFDVRVFGDEVGDGMGAGYDQAIVMASPVVVDGANLNLSFDTTQYVPAPGHRYTIIDNRSNDPVGGQFAGLVEGEVFEQGGFRFSITYQGGDGNDVVLTSQAPTIVYVSPAFTSHGQAVDGDREESGVQSATVGYDAFASIDAALAAHPNYSGPIVVNGGMYASASLLGGGAVALRLVRDLTDNIDNVVIGTITGSSDDQIVTRYHGDSGGNLTLQQGTFAGSIHGAGNLAKTGGGSSVLYLDGPNTYQGLTTVSNGYLVARHSLALGDAATGTIVQSGATLQLENGAHIASESLTISGNGVGGTRGALAGWSGHNRYGGPVTLAANSSIFVNSDSLTVSGVIDGANSLTKTGAGTLTLSGGNANTYSGLTNVRQGTLVAAKDGALGTTNGKTVVSSGASLLLSGDIDYASAETIELSGDGAGAVMGNLSGVNTFRGDVRVVSAGAATRGTFTGGDVGEGLDLDGSFVYAVNVRGPAVGLIRNADFTNDAVPGVSITAQNELLNWQNPNFGATTNDTRLATAMQSIRWSGNPNPVDVNLDVTAGQAYRLQLMFYEPPQSRGFDIFAEGNLIYDNYVSNGGAANVGTVATYAFVASDNQLNIRLSGVDTTFGDKNPILSGFTLETIPAISQRMGAATIRSSAGNLTLTGQVDLLGSAVQVDGSGATNISGNIVGSNPANSLTKTGSGTLTLSGDNAYGGATTVSTGMLAVQGGNAIPDASPVAIEFGSLILHSSETLGSLTGGGSVNLNSHTLTTGADDASTSYTGSITGSGGLTKIGSGTFTLAGSNSYTGATNVNQGVLQLGGGAAAPNIAGLAEWFDAADADTIVTSGGAVSQWQDKTGNNRHLNQSIVANQPTHVAGALNGLPVVRFDGNDVLSNTYNPGTPYTVFSVARYEGTQNFRVVTSTANNWLLGFWSGGVDRMFAEGWVSQPSGVDTALHFYGATGTGSLTTFFDAGRYIARNSTGVAAPNGLSLGAWQANPTGEASKADVAEVLLYNGVLTPSQIADVVAYLKAKWSSGSTLADSSAVNVTAGASLVVNVADTVGNLSGAGTVTLNQMLTLNQADSTTFSGLIGGPAGLTKTGSGTLLISGENTYQGPTDIQGGTLVAAHNNALGDASSGTSVRDGATLTLSGGITVAGETLLLDGAGVGGSGALVSETGENTVDGVVQARIALNGEIVLGASLNSTLTIAGTIDLQVSDLRIVGAGNIDIPATITSLASHDNAVLAAAPQAFYRFEETSGMTAFDSVGSAHGSYDNGVLLGQASVAPEFGYAPQFDGVNDMVTALLNVNEGPDPGYSVSLWFKTSTPGRGIFNVTSGNLGENDRNIVLETNGNITARIWNLEIITSTGLNLADGQWHHVTHVFGSAVGGQRLYVDGQLVASGTRNFSNFNWQDRIRIGQSSYLPSGGGQFFQGQIDSAAVFARSLTADEVAGLYRANNHVTKQGTGTLTLSGANAYTDGTTLAGGTLLVNNASGSGTGSGAVTVEAGTLGGTGTIHGSVQVNSGGTLSPGTSPGILNTGSITCNNGSTYLVELGGTTPGNTVTDHDQDNVTGSVTINTARLSVTTFGSFLPSNATQQSFVIVNNDGSDPILPSVAGTAAGAHFLDANNGNALLLEGSPVTVSGASIPLYITYHGGDGNDVVLNTQPVINGTPGNDTLVLRKSDTAGFIEFSLNGAAFQLLPDTLPFTFHGMEGTDLLLVDTSNGNPIPSGGVSYTGEILRVERVGGEAADTATLAASAPVGQGLVTLDSMGDIQYSGASHVDFVNLASVNLQTGTLDDVIDVADGTTATNDATVPAGYSIASAPNLAISGLGVIVGLRSVTEAGLSTVAGGGDGADEVTIHSGTETHGITGLNIDTGSSTDTVTISGPLAVGGDINIRSQNISFTNLGTLTAGAASSIKLDAGSGAITRAAGNDLTHLIAQSLDLAAGTGIGGSNVPVHTLAQSLHANVSAAGSIYLNDKAGGVTLTGVSTLAGAIKVLAGGGTLTVANPVSAGGTGDVLLHAASGDLAINAAVAAGRHASLLASANVTQSADGDVTAGGTLDVHAQSGSISMADGATGKATSNTRYLAAQNITLGGVSGADVRIVATAGSILDGGDSDVNLVATNAQLVAGTSIGQPSAGAIDTTVDTLAALAGGNIYVVDTGSLIIGSVAAIDVARVLMDNTTATQAGALLVGAVAAQNVKVQAATDLAVANAVTATANDLLLSALDGNLAVGAAVTATAGNASLLASANVTQSADGDVTAGGTLDVHAQSGSISMADGAVSQAGGNLRYLATGNVTLGSLVAPNVRVQAGVSIIDGGNTNVDVVATTAQLVAGTSVGEPAGTNNGAIDTTVGTLAASAGTGNIYARDTTSLTVGSVAAIPVNRVQVDSTSPAQSGSALAGAVASGEIDIVAQEDLTVNQPVQAGGDVTLTGGAADTGADTTINAAVQTSGETSTVRVYGGAGPDTITVNVTGASDLTLDGRGGNDQYVVQLGGMGGGNVEIADSGNTNGDRATVYATEADERLTVNNVDPAEETTAGGTVYVGVAPVERVRYTGSLEFLTVMGEGGSDTFHVQPSRTAEITVNGGSPHFGDGVPPGGDMLDFDSFDNTFTLICGTILTDDKLNASSPFRPVHYRSIENMPLDPLGKTEPLRFDMNWTAAATQAGYTSVLPTTVYNASDPLSTFGWDAPLYGFDRGTTSFTSDFANLLRDGHWHSAMRTFTAEVESGWYLVSVKSGDKSFARDRLRVTDANTVSEADPAGRVLLDNVSSPAGQIVERTFLVFVPEGQNLALTFADLGGDPYWVVNGIEIRPGRILTFGSPETDAKLTADGVTQTTFTGYLATPGALVTVDPQLDTQGDYRPEGTVTIVSPPDADPDVAGHQVRANEVGEFTYTIVHPSVAGTMRVMYAEVTGAQASCFSVDFVAPSVRRFDFNSGASPTQAPVAQDGTPNGYVGVLPTQLTSPAVGYGWVSAAQGFDRGALTTTTYSNLLRDGAWGSAPRDFRMQLWPGTYDVTVTFGDASFARDQMNVTVVTGSVVSDLPNVTNVSTAAGQFVHRSFKASPTDGELVLQFSDSGGDPYWTVNAVEVRAAAALVTVGTPGETPAADAVSVLNYAVSGASVGSLYTVSATGGATLVDLNGVAIVDTDPRYAGIQIVAPSASFTLGVRSPSSAGNVTVALAEVNGASRGSATQAYGYAPLRRFDFNGSGVDTQLDAAGNFWNVRGSDVFDPAVGHGWNAAVSEFQRGTAGISEPLLAALYRDGHWQSATRTFQVGVDKNKTYDVRIHTGDRSFARDQLRITVEGIVVEPSVATAANQFQAITVTVPANTVGVDGILDIEIANLGGDPYWVINGIEVAESDRCRDLPVPPPPTSLTAPLRFDFGTSSSPVDTPDFIGVGATNAYNPDLGYGWQANAPTFSRGIANPLLRDGHWGTSNTFNVNVPGSIATPVTYLVNVTLGDASFARNNISVWAEGILQHSDLATAAGQFIHRSFEVEVTDGQLNVQIASSSGDPYFTINALEIFETQAPLTFSGWPSDPVVANGTAVDRITVNNATAGALYTVSVDLGTIVGSGESGTASDASSQYAGFQVQVPALATGFTFDVRRPTGIGAGAAKIRVEEVTGLKKGELNQTYALPAVRRYDFNGSGNDIQSGFTGVRGNTLYNANNGYGWTSTVSEFQRGTTGYSINPANVPLYRDGHWGSAARTFQVAVDPDETYNVRVYVGDRSFARNLIQVTVEGAGSEIIPSTAANGFVAVTVVGGKATDGILDITIINTGGDPYWVINGIDVWQSGANDPGALNLLPTSWSSETVGHRLTESALDAVLPLAREYWVSTGLADWQLTQLYQTPIAIGDLSYRGALGVAKPEGIWLDASGAGLGWSVGSSQLSVVSGPWAVSSSTSEFRPPSFGYDLLTVVTHELGHVLGHGDLDPHDHPDHIMAGVLQPGAGRVEIASGGSLGWLAGGESPLLALGRADGGRPTDGGRPADGGRGPLGGGRGLLVDRVLDDLLRDDLRVSKDAWSRDEDDEFERLLRQPSGDRQEEIDDFFARLE